MRVPNFFLSWAVLFLLASPAAIAQSILPQVNTKMGKPTNEEMTMTAYAPDSTAKAVVLYSETTADYSWGAEDFMLTYRIKKRIKILSEEALEQANVSITYYENKTNRTTRESVSGLEASAYNLEDGKTVRTKMKREQVFEERLDDNYVTLKFSIPQARVGSVIEYEYRLTSDRYYIIRPWKPQEEIPVVQAHYEITVPEYFRFATDMHGTQPMKSEREEVNLSLILPGARLSCSGTRYSYTASQLPALKTDKYIWCADNYRTQVNMELTSIAITGVYYKDYTQTWEKIDQLLLDDSDFGQRMKPAGNPLAEELEKLPLDRLTTTREKATAIFVMMKSHLKWNKRYALYARSGKQVMKDGTGDNADLNAIYIGLLRKAGLQAHPVVMSLRSRPMLPHTHPTLQKIGTYIVAIDNAEEQGGTIYMDASAEMESPAVLPPVLLTDRARIIRPQGQSQWTNLQQAMGRNSRTVMLEVDIAPDGTISGRRITKSTGQEAAELKREFHAAKDSLDFLEQTARKLEVQIEDYSCEGVRTPGSTTQETLTFTKQATLSEPYIYLNPLIFPFLEETPLTQAERQLPVEFAYPYQANVNATLRLPQGYTVDETPTPCRLANSDKSLQCSYVIATTPDGAVNLRYTFRLGKLVFTPQEYPELKHFMELVTEHNNALMVLKQSTVDK
ncbi:MAG: DUF3857 domain-containing protein [Bacteroides sp.]|nr:DUF3857 domain-containing protein [Bacteroides sp.]